MIDLERFRRGEPEYFETLVEQHGWLVQRVVEAHWQDPDEAQDCYQETWVRVYRNRKSFSGSGSFEGWLHRIARNVCVNLCVKGGRRWRLLKLLKTGWAKELMGWNPPDPSRETERREREQRLHKALTQLTDREREAITLRLFEGRDAQEVAEIMGIKASTVRSIIRHGAARLKNVMEE